MAGWLRLVRRLAVWAAGAFAAAGAAMAGPVTAPVLQAASPPSSASVPPTGAATPATPRRAALDYGLKARALATGVFVVEGAVDDFTPDNGCNIINTGFISTPAGAVVVNTGPSRLYGQQLRSLVRATTGQDVAAVVHLNLHPDYFLGNQAFADVPRWATGATIEGIRRESAAYETNLFRLCGDWMKDTQTVLPNADLGPAVQAGQWTVGGRTFELVELKGHTDSDLVLIDRLSGVVFAGGLVFADRVPTTPHAQLGDWLTSLQRLAARPGLAQATVVPSHGPVHRGLHGLRQTERFLAWLDAHLRTAAQEGWDMNELLRSPVPAPFKDWAAFRTEWVRNVAHLYPRYEQQAFGAARR